MVEIREKFRLLCCNPAWAALVAQPASFDSTLVTAISCTTDVEIAQGAILNVPYVRVMTL